MDRRLERSDAIDDIHKVVERNIIRYYGKTVPAGAIVVVTVEGLTLRERMVQDRIALLKNGGYRATT